MLPPSLGRYKIVSQIGTGAMAVIYRARDENLGRDVAIKILHAHLTEKQEHIQRFVREARALAQLPHPNIVQIYDFGSDDDVYYIVSEFVDGKDLSQILSQVDPLPPPVAVMVFLQLLDAIDYAHRHGIVHRDIKLENVIFGSDGIIKLTDFGIAHIFEWDKLTLPGALIGSPYYMAPEIISGDPANQSSDLFSAGVLLYRILTGKFPFHGNNPASVLKSIIEESPEKPERVFKNIDKELGGIVLSCLEKDHKRRPGVEKIKGLLSAYLEPFNIMNFSEELKKFYSDPTAYHESRKGDFINSLIEHARLSINRRDYAGAISLLNRALHLGALRESVYPLINRAQLSKNLRWYPLVLVLSLALLTGGLKLYERFYQNMTAEQKGGQLILKSVQKNTVTILPPVREEKPKQVATKKTKKIQEKPIDPPAVPVVEETTSGEVKKGRLLVRTNPWAEVYVDGRFYGRTPFLDVIELPSGKHLIEVKNPYAEPVKKEIFIEEDKLLTENIPLSLIPGSIDIVLNVDAKLYIDGELVGTGSRFEKIKVNQGRHRIRIEKSGYRPVEKTIDITAGEFSNLSFTLVKEPMIWKD